MYSKFPFSMENIPRQTGFACLSLKFGCIFSALIIIIHSVLSLATCMAGMIDLATVAKSDDMWSMLSLLIVVTATIIYIVTLFLTTLMLIGTLREKPQLMRPWITWTSIQVIIYLMVFIYFTTMSFINHVGGNSIILYFMEFLGLLLKFYMLMLVASYCKQLEEERFDGERLKTFINQESWYNSA